VGRGGEVRAGFWWGSPKGKWPLGRPSCRWEDNNQIDVEEVEWGGIDWTDLAQDRKK